MWFIDMENLFHSYFERKNDKVLTFDFVYFPNFEISTSLLLAAPSKISAAQFQNLVSIGGACKRKSGNTFCCLLQFKLLTYCFSQSSPNRVLLTP